MKQSTKLILIGCLGFLLAFILTSVIKADNILVLNDARKDITEKVSIDFPMGISREKAIVILNQKYNVPLKNIQIHTHKGMYSFTKNHEKILCDSFVIACYEYKTDKEFNVDVFLSFDFDSNNKLVHINTISVEPAAKSDSKPSLRGRREEIQKGISKDFPEGLSKEDVIATLKRKYGLSLKNIRSQSKQNSEYERGDGKKIKVSSDMIFHYKYNSIKYLFMRADVLLTFNFDEKDKLIDYSVSVSYMK